MDLTTSEKPIILAADDQPGVLHTIASILKPYYGVRPLTSGQAALSYLENHNADLILLDYYMPGMTGFDVMEKLQADQKTRRIPVIFLTGSEDGSKEVEALERGAVDYISKPIRAKVLLTRIKLQIELSHYRSHMEALVEERTQKIRLREDIALNLLAEATDLRDHKTGDHVSRTTEIVRVLVSDLLNDPNPAGDYQIEPQEADDIIRSSKLHDIGKIAVADQILLKPGSLDSREFEAIRQHPLHGATLLDKYNNELGDDSFLQTAKDIALCHHEKWNGSGYPLNLAGEEIPLSARITALADVYDALVSSRPYKDKFPHDKAVSIIAEESGTHFDPYLVELFMRNEKKIQEISTEIV